MKQSKIFLLLAAFLFQLAMAPWLLSYGQAEPVAPVSAEHRTGRAGGDPIRQLNLTPEQREQIRSIRQQMSMERAAINQRVAEANRALEAALDSDNPDEAAVEQKMRELAAAQADAMRMRISDGSQNQTRLDCRNNEPFCERYDSRPAKGNVSDLNCAMKDKRRRAERPNLRISARPPAAFSRSRYSASSSSLTKPNISNYRAGQASLDRPDLHLHLPPTARKLLIRRPSSLTHCANFEHDKSLFSIPVISH